ncbi:MAG: nucleotide sugar dehydrogenase [Pirellulaceae bacterium]|nr:nucleotide sugar dehydrogenase [Pirellulaceae bacterium]
MKVSIFGTGYVGVVSLACLLRDGHQVVGIDPVRSKIDDLSQGRTPIQEPQVAALISAGHAAGRLRATIDPAEGIHDSEMLWLCVGTPSRQDGVINLDFLSRAIQDIGKALRKVKTKPLIVIRSTVLPGTTQNKLVPVLENASGMSVGRDIHVVYHPEFLREGSAVNDFDDPPKIVVGELTERTADRLLALYKNCQAPRFRLQLAEAELVKYCDNLFHAVKITFANEIGAIAKELDIDARIVADVFCADRKLNISSRYLRPGFAFGGSCLPKDLRAMLRRSTELSVDVPMLNSVLSSNRLQVERLVDRILAVAPQQVGLVGLAFKSNTDDMRESPYVDVAKRLIGEGIPLKIYDEGVQPERLIGSNKDSVHNALGHLEKWLVATCDELASCELILINHASVTADHVHTWLDKNIMVVDLVGISDVDHTRGKYTGIAW